MSDKNLTINFKCDFANEWKQLSRQFQSYFKRNPNNPIPITGIESSKIIKACELDRKRIC